jgi:hypothetical protein
MKNIIKSYLIRASDVLCDDLGKLDLKFRRKDGPGYAKDRANRFSFIDPFYTD